MATGIAPTLVTASTSSMAFDASCTTSAMAATSLRAPVEVSECTTVTAS